MKNLSESAKLAIMIVLACVVTGSIISELLVIFLDVNIVTAIFLGQLGAYSGLGVFGLTGALLMYVLGIDY